MNTKQLIVTVAMLAATGSVFAQQAEYVAPVANSASGKTRAEVIDELKQAQANGTYVVGGEEYPGQFSAVARNVRSRAEAIESARNGKTPSGVAGS
ncbi:MAG: hypothetical protein JWQ21_1929 [Herminiimonas sp.]|nr:hypothetical protein [Herminiimonas sp.]